MCERTVLAPRESELKLKQTYRVSNFNVSRESSVQVGNGADDSAILNVCETTNLYLVLVASQDSTIPNLQENTIWTYKFKLRVFSAIKGIVTYRNLVKQKHITNHGGVGRNETTSSNDRALC